MFKHHFLTFCSLALICYSSPALAESCDCEKTNTTSTNKPTKSDKVQHIPDRSNLDGRGFLFFMPVGLILGGSTGDEGGFILGGEVSIDFFEDSSAFWFGLNTDALYDFGRSQMRTSIGPQIGFWGLGLETSAVLAADSTSTNFGARVGGVLTTSLLGFFVRYTYMFTPQNTDHFEIGALLKFPINFDD